MSKDNNMDKEYIGAVDRFYNDVINAKNNIRMIDGKRSLYLSAKTQMKLFDGVAVLDYVTDEDIEKINEYSVGKPCSLISNENNSIVYGIVKNVAFDKARKKLTVCFVDYVIDLYDDELGTYDVTIGNDIIVDVEPIEIKCVLNSYRYDEEATKNKASFIITDSEYYHVLDRYVDIESDVNKEMLAQEYNHYFGGKIDAFMGLWNDKKNDVVFPLKDIIYNNYGDVVNINVSKADIKKLADTYAGKVVSFCDDESIYYGIVWKIKMNHRTKDITIQFEDGICIMKDGSDMTFVEDVVIDHRFNKMFVDGKLFADMESFKKVLLCMYEYLEIKEDVIWDDYQTYKPSDWDEYDEEFEIEDDDF